MSDPDDSSRNIESAELFDRQKLRDNYDFVVGALRRHWRLAGGIFVVIMGLAILAVATLPRKYHVEAKVLAQTNQALSVGSEDPNSNAPTRGAVELIRGRENLSRIVRATDLVRHYESHRSLAQRARDAVMGWVSGPQTEQAKTDAMVDLLEKRLSAWTSDGTVTISIDWTDPQMAVRLVDEAEQNFLLARYSQEVSAIVDSIGIIRRHAKDQKADVDAAVAAAEKVTPGLGDRGEKKASRGRNKAAPARVVHRSVVRRTGPAPDLGQLKLTIDAKQRVINDLEDMRRRRLAEAQAKLAELKTQYTDNHPSVIDARQTIVGLSRPSPQVASLQRELAPLKAEYQRKAAQARQLAAAAGAASRPTISASITPPRLSNDIVGLDSALRLQRDPAAVYAHARLRDAMDKYAALRAQAQKAQMDLETARAAFKYRYNVVSPPEFPRKPVSPKVPLIIVAAFIAALFAGVFFAVVADLRKGRLVERFQIERMLDRPLLGEIDLRLLPRHRLK